MNNLGNNSSVLQHHQNLPIPLSALVGVVLLNQPPGTNWTTKTHNIESSVQSLNYHSSSWDLVLRSHCVISLLVLTSLNNDIISVFKNIQVLQKKNSHSHSHSQLLFYLIFSCIDHQSGYWNKTKGKMCIQSRSNPASPSHFGESKTKILLQHKRTKT